MGNTRLLFFLAASIMLITLSLSIVSAATTINETSEAERINKAYNWLSNSVSGKLENTTSTEDLAFTLLALAYDDNIASQARDALSNKKSSAGCWPSASCKPRETALASLALARIGVTDEETDEWLMSQNGTPTEMTWFMQVDSNEESVCTISYDTFTYNVTLNTNKKLNKAAGSCLILSYGNYWFKISSACYEKKFTINCDKDFVASLFYQKPGATTVYISSDTKIQSAKGDADLKINSVCIKKDGSCNYEATAWTALSLVKKQDISIFLPYLVGYKDSNTRLLPDAFLYLLTGQEDYVTSLTNLQRKSGYWQADLTPYDKYYDTALAMLALQSYNFEKKFNTRAWLLNEQVQTGDSAGSWGSNKKDTAFLLYAIWPKEGAYIPFEESAKKELKCIDYGFYCEQSYNCDFENRITDYSCEDSSFKVCCNQKYEEKTRTCNEMGGLLCDSSLDYRCEGTTKSSSEGICCMGYCTKEAVNICESNNHVCRPDSCLSGEQSNSDSCPDKGDVCCEESNASIPSKKNNNGWIFFIVILILVAGLVAFLFRDKFKGRKPRFSEGGLAYSRRPGVPPVRPPARFASYSPLNRNPSLRRTQTDKELDETLKKLKESSGR